MSGQGTEREKKSAASSSSFGNSNLGFRFFIFLMFLFMFDLTFAIKSETFYFVKLIKIVDVRRHQISTSFPFFLAIFIVFSV